jgi:hypothetical protein
MSESICLAFDIGIRNLAWCVMKKENNKTTILGWDNYDLLAGSSANEVQSNKKKCCACSANASYETRGGSYCVKHCPSDRPPLRDLSGNLLRGLPQMQILKQIIQTKGYSGTAKTKAALTEEARKYYSLPITKEKVKKAINTELSILHDGIRKLIIDRQELFSQCTDILLENQPVLKNPTMKSVQMLLFATLRDILQPSPPSLHLVHAKKKVEGAAKGDEGYKQRKQGSEDRVAAAFGQKKVDESQKWKQYLEKYTKKNDLTDAFCMCLDFLKVV